MSEIGNEVLSEVILRIQREIQTLRDTAHILTPMARTKIDSVAIGKVPVLRVASIDPDPEHKEVYELRQQPGKFALTKVGLMRLEAIAGITGWTSKTEAVDNNPLKVKATAYAEIEDIDGTIRGKPQTFMLDLTDGSPQASKMKPGELAQARANIFTLAESKAMNRVRRDLLNLQATFTKAELKKPFVIMRLVDAPLNAKDPLVHKLLIMKQLKITSEMYDSAMASLPTPLEIPALPLPPALPPVSDETKTGDDFKKKLIEEVEELYKRKVRGGRSANKAPLQNLSDGELNQIKEALSGHPDLK